MNLLQWLREILWEPEPAQAPVAAQVEALAAAWGVPLAVAWHLVKVCSAQYQVPMDAAVGALQGMDLDEAKVQVGET